jgi:hypothetical protein
LDIKNYSTIHQVCATTSKFRFALKDFSSAGSVKFQTVCLYVIFCFKLILLKGKIVQKNLNISLYPFLCGYLWFSSEAAAYSASPPPPGQP